MPTPTVVDLYNRLGTLTTTWQTFIDQQRDWLGGPIAADDPSGNEGKRPLSDSVGNTFLLDTPAQLAYRITAAAGSIEGLEQSATTLIAQFDDFELRVPAIEQSLANSESTFLGYITTVEGFRDEVAPWHTYFSSNFPDFVTDFENFRDNLKPAAEAAASTAATKAGEASGSASDALAYRNTSLGYRDEIAPWHTFFSTNYPTFNTHYVDYRDNLKPAAEAAASTAATKAGEASNSEGLALQYKDLAFQYRNEAEQFRNEAGDIAGGDFVTTSIFNTSVTSLQSEIDTDVAAAVAGLTKADVGLDNVPNYGATSLYDAGSTSKLATQKAVYDLKQELDNLAAVEIGIPDVNGLEAALADKATAAELRKVKIFALAGL